MSTSDCARLSRAAGPSCQGNSSEAIQFLDRAWITRLVIQTIHRGESCRSTNRRRRVQFTETKRWRITDIVLRHEYGRRAEIALVALLNPRLLTDRHRDTHIRCDRPQGQGCTDQHGRPKAKQCTYVGASRPLDNKSRDASQEECNTNSLESVEEEGRRLGGRWTKLRLSSSDVADVNVLIGGDRAGASEHSLLIVCDRDIEALFRDVREADFYLRLVRHGEASRSASSSSGIVWALTCPVTSTISNFSSSASPTTRCGA